MDETYEQMKARLHPERYEVVRRTSGTARMTTGRYIDGQPEMREEPAVWATIRHLPTGRTVVREMGLNSLSCAIPLGPSGKLYPRGVEATDEELILAVVGDEPIFG